MNDLSLHFQRCQHIIWWMKQILTQIMAQTMIQMLMKKMPFLTTFQITEYKLNGLCIMVLILFKIMLSEVSLLQNKYIFFSNDKLLLPRGQLHQVLWKIFSPFGQQHLCHINKQKLHINISADSINYQNRAITSMPINA